MRTSLLLEGGDSTYNEDIGGVRESKPVTTASQQYWALRQVQVEAKISQIESSSSTSEAELNWKKFCLKGISFLDHLLWRAIDRLEKPLRSYWNGDKRLAKDGVRVFKEHALVELLIPFSRTPVRFARVARTSSEISSKSPGSIPHRSFNWAHLIWL